MNSKNYFKEVFTTTTMDKLAFMLTLAFNDPAIAMRMSATEFPGGELTEVKESPCHGVGLFAKKDITAGATITMYPIHQYLVKTEDGTWAMNSAFDDEEPYDGYGLNVDENTQIFGCPTFRGNGMFNGHLANDPVMSLDHSDMNKFILSYILASKARGNTKYQKKKHIVSLVAVRDIKAGEEILVPYSLPYWFDDFGVNTDVALADFINYTKSLPIHKHKFITDLMFQVAKIFD
jgi:hypothetical protein